MEIRLARAEDIDAWMALVEQVRDVFPGLETAEAMAEHRATVLGFMKNSSAVCAAEAGHILGGLLFSKKNSMLGFLAGGPGLPPAAHCAKAGVLDADADGAGQGHHRDHLPGGEPQRHRRPGFL